MSYHSYAGQTGEGYVNETFGYPQTYMIDDVAALQAMYGADYTVRGGNTVYSWSPTTGETFVDGIGHGAPGNGAGGSANRLLTLWDGGGNDTYSFANYATSVTIDLRPGKSSSTGPSQLAYLGDGHYALGNIYNALLYQNSNRSVIENAIGSSASDKIVGNHVANRLEGGAGADMINGLYGQRHSDRRRRLGRIRVHDRAFFGQCRSDRGFLGAGRHHPARNAVFTAFAATGPLAAAAVHKGTAAADASDRVIYDKASGALVW